MGGSLTMAVIVVSLTGATLVMATIVMLVMLRVLQNRWFGMAADMGMDVAGFLLAGWALRGMPHGFV